MSADGTPRRVLLVGSLPYQDEASAMARACALAGDRLIALPDGEIGERSERYPAGDRSQWVAGLAGRLAGEMSLFDVVDEGTMNDWGFPVDFGSIARLRPRCGPAEFGDRLRLGYDTFALRSWPHVERLRASTGRPDLGMQVGLPTGLGIAAGSSPAPTGPAAYRALRHLALPTGTRLVAGFVHEQPTLQSLQELLRTIEQARGGQVDIASACGLGRRTADTADEQIRRCRHLAAASA